MNSDEQGEFEAGLFRPEWTPPGAMPGLGQFTSPIDTVVAAGSARYRCQGTAQLAPLTGGQFHFTGGTVTLTPVQPAPAPTPAPTPQPSPAPTPAPAPTPQPSPAPRPAALNVRDFGARGDGVTDDRNAIQAAIDKAGPDGLIYVPAGTYLLTDWVRVVKSGVGLFGDGPPSILLNRNNNALQLGVGGEALTGLSVRQLAFVGQPGRYKADGANGGGIQVFGPKGTVIEECDFTGCANPLYSAGAQGTTYGTIIRNCRVHGWGVCAVFCNGGEQITGCQLVQDDPDLNGERSSHAFYIHSGANDVLVADSLIANARKYAIQVFGSTPGTTIERVTLRNLTVQGCANGITADHPLPGIAEIKDLLIDGCTITGTYQGNAITLRNGTGVTVRNCTLDQATGAGISAGVWAPYQPGCQLRNVQLTGNTIRRCARGLWFLDSNGGKLIDVVAQGNTVTGNQIDIDGAHVAGVTVS